MTDSPVETVLFDLDDTLVAYPRAASAVLADAFDAVGVAPVFPVEAYFERYDEFLTDAASLLDLREACFAALAEERGVDVDVGRAVARAFTERRDPDNVELLPGAAEVLATLADDHGCRLGLVTNGPPMAQRPKLSAVGLDGRFETVVFAGHDTAPKPDPAPFRRALSALDAAADAAVHVGNSLASDVAGAAAAGLRSAWIPAYAEEATATPDYRLESLADLGSPPWPRD